MRYSQSGLALTEQFEDCKLEAYPDPGTGGAPWTIGYGHTRGVRQGDTCTPMQAELWLLQDVREAEAAVNRLVTTELTQEEFDALVDFVFNCGIENFRNSTLLKKINAGDHEGAAVEFDKWIYASGKKLAGLMRRRAAEKALFLKGHQHHESA